MTIKRVRHSPGGVDQYGDPVAGTTTLTTITGAFVAPRTTEDIDDRGRTGVIVGLTLFAPYDTDLTYADQIDVDGVVYDIEGEPGRWRNPFTDWKAGIQVALSRAQG